LIACEGREQGTGVEVNSNIPLSEQIAAITEEINANRMNAFAFHKRSQLHLYNRNLPQAIDDVSVAIKIDGTVADFHYTLSDIHFANGDIVLSTEALSTGLELDPDNIQALLALAELYYVLKDMKSSVSLLKRVTAIDKHNAQAYLIHGMIFTELGDTARAMSSLQTAVENDPNLEKAYLELGLLHYARLNRLTVDYLNNVIALNPENIFALYTKSMFYQKTGEVDLASDTYLQLLEINPDNAEAHYNLGHICVEFKGDFEGGMKHFSNAIRSDSNHYKAFYMRGLCLESLAQYKEARGEYLKSLDLKINYELAIQGLNRLDKLDQ